MPEWKNWSGRLQASPSTLKFPRSEKDVQHIVTAVRNEGGHLRVAGATHSHAPLVTSDHTLLDLQAFSGVVSVDHTDQTAWVRAGTRIFALGLALHKYGLALHNQGDIDQQTLAGAIATGTHGTGRTLGNLSSAVKALRMVTADGEVVTCSNTHLEGLWQAGRINLGALGVVTEVQLELKPNYRLEEQSWTCSLDEALEQADNLSETYRHFEFFWYPQTDSAVIKVINETQAEAVYPLADEGQRRAWSYEVLPNHRPHPHTEMEYAIAAEHAVPCMEALRDLLINEFPDVQWPIEMRYLAADDVWLSQAYQQATVTLSVHQDVRLDETAYFKACEELFLSFDGRPHWGKVHYLNGDKLASQHPRWSDWWAVRNELDPDGVFLNDYLLGLRP